MANKSFAIFVAIAVIAASCVMPAAADGDQWEGPAEDWSDKSADELFDMCICWDAKKDQFCGGNQFWRKPCTEYVKRTFLWAIPAIMLLVAYLLFPFLFGVARFVCNCCGGRKPSYGCCFPHDSMCCPRDKEGEVPVVRQYTARAIFLTKLFMLVVIGVQIYYAVGTYVTNARVHDSVMDLVGNVRDSVGSVGGEMRITTETFQSFEDNNVAFAPASTHTAIAALLEAGLAYNHTVNQVNDVLNHVKKYENQQNWGRASWMYRIPSLPLALILFVLIALTCNFRGWGLSIIACLLSWTAVLVTVAFIVSMCLAQITSQGCSSYKSTVVPTIVDVVQSRKGCSNPAVMTPMLDTATLFFNQTVSGGPVAGAGLSALCNNFFDCDKTVADLVKKGASASFQAGFLGVFTALELAPVRQQMASSVRCVFPADFTGVKICSIANCAKFCPIDNGAAKAARQLVSFMELSRYPSTTWSELGSAYSDFANCSGIRNQLNGAAHDTLCGEFNRNATNISVTLLAQMVNLVFVVLLTILGAKRFMKMPERKEGEGIVYGILVSNEEEAHRIGEPIGSPSDVLQYGHPVQYGTDPQYHAMPIQQQDGMSAASMKTV